MEVVAAQHYEGTNATELFTSKWLFMLCDFHLKNEKKKKFLN